MRKVNFYRGTKENPFHLSVGVILVNDANEIAVLHYRSLSSITKIPSKYRSFSNIYTLITETLKSNETLEEAVKRALHEEAGASGEILCLLGSKISSFSRSRSVVEKTTIYFLTKLIEIDQNKRERSEEIAASEIVWITIDSLANKMQEQANRLKLPELNDSDILTRLKEILDGKEIPGKSKTQPR